MPRSHTVYPSSRSILGTVLSVFIAGPVQADNAASEPVPSVSLGKVLVSATRVESEVDDVARPVAIVEREAIESIQPQSVGQALRYEPNVTISGGPRSDSQGVNIRGLEGSKVLQTVDGARQSFESGHRPSYFLDPELLKNVEVIKGPASILWGSGALGGVVAQNTVDASDLLSPAQEMGGFVKAGFNANNDQQRYVSALAGRGDTTDWLLSAYHRDQNEAALGNGENLQDSARRDNGAMAKASWQLTEDQSLKVIYRQSEENGHVPSNGAANVNGASVFLIDRQTETQNAVLGYDLDTSSDWINARISTYWNHVEMQESRVSDGRGDGTELEEQGLSFQNRSQLSQLSQLSLLHGVSFFFGLDAYTQDFKATRGGNDRPAPPNAETQVWGAYLSARLPVSQGLELELGARHDSFETEAKNLNSKQDDSDLSPSIALIWQASDRLALTLRHDRAFRAPSAEELYTTGTHFCFYPGFCNTFQSNPDLKPEKAANTELMARVEFEPNASGGQLFLEASLFENRVDDFIEQTVTDPSFGPIMDPGITTWDNVEDATLRGIELSTHYIEDDFTLMLAYGQTRGKDDQSGDFLNGIPADKATADASYHWLDTRLTTGVRLSQVAAQRRTSNGETYDGYTLADVYASWSPASLEILTLDLTVNNLTDRYYRQAWQELYSPGREIILATKFSF